MEKQKFRICSDLHSEFWRGENLWPELVPELETDKHSILLLAGDIGINGRVNFDWFDEVVGRFQDYMYIPGNHEYYQNSINQEPDDVVVRTFAEGKVRVIGTTLWTDMDNSNPLAMVSAQRGMADYSAIYSNSPEHTVYLNKGYRARLDELVRYGDVVVSHHPPSYKSLTPGFENSPLNPAFLNNLDAFVLDLQPALWVHGHVHSSHDYHIGETRVICNPYGYYKHEVNKDYNPELVVEI